MVATRRSASAAAAAAAARKKSDDKVTAAVASKGPAAAVAAIKTKKTSPKKKTASVVTKPSVKKKKKTYNPDEAIANLKFAKVYPLYLSKVEKKGRTEKELLQVIEWLTGYGRKALMKHSNNDDVTFREFFAQAPKINVNVHLITGKICGITVEDIKTPLTQQCRYMDKLVDELAKGWKIEKILRGGSS